jgi:hypothetical protein
MHLPFNVLLSFLAMATPLLQEPDFAQFASGEGPTYANETYHLLDREGTFSQSNAVGFARQELGARSQVTLTAQLQVLEGGDGGSFVFLNTAEFGSRGPAPFLGSWVEPNLSQSFGVGIDVHNPIDEDPFRGHGNYQGLPQREISLHWDGRELVKRVTDTEFRGVWADLEVSMRGVPGGSEVSVRLGESLVFDSYFVAGMAPFESRLAIGASTRAEVATQFDVRNLSVDFGQPAAAPRPALHFPVFNHVLTNNGQTAFEAEVDLPPGSWEFGRVVLTLQIHDAGKDWDEWDRNGVLSIWDDQGGKHSMVPFITSYRTECFWQVDVTAFRPWLSGKTRFEVAAGTSFYKGRGFMMSVDLDFYHGTPQLGGAALAPYLIVPLWEGTANYGSAEKHYGDFFVPKQVEIPLQTRAARVMTFTTGHSQVGEFTPSTRTITFRPTGTDVEGEFTSELWKTDVYLNPNRPQGGTWKYSRAGWAPGDIVHPWWVDVTDYIQPGIGAEVTYVAAPYDFSESPEGERPAAGTVNQASQVVSSYLVLYREPGELVAAPVLRVTGVTGGSSAANAGLQVGDYLSSYGGRKVDSVADLTNAKAAAVEAGLTLAKIVIYRGEQRLDLEMATGSMGVNLSER